MIRTAIDSNALSDALKHWLLRCPSHRSDDTEDPDCIASMMAHDLTDDKHPGATFTLGFKVGVLAAAAVIGDPLGNPVDRIESALAEVREELAEYERYRHVYLGDAKS